MKSLFPINKKPLLALLVALPLTFTPALSSITANSPQPSASVDLMPDNAAWVYNFASQPDGPVSSQDFNFDTGTGDNQNGEVQTYTDQPENVRVQNGVLMIEATPGATGTDYTSARINTKGKFSFEYGTLEVDAKLPPGTGTWPAAWLMPENDQYLPQTLGINSNDPYAWVLNGEIDFMEEIGRTPGQNLPAAHSYNSRRSGISQYTPAQVPNASTTYHRYGIIKTPDSITFTLDGVPYATRQKTSNDPRDWPYNQPYYLIMDLAMGGHWAGADGIDNSTAPWQLDVKSISYQPL